MYKKVPSHRKTLVYFDKMAIPITIPIQKIFNPDIEMLGFMGTVFTINKILSNQKKIWGVSGSMKTPVIINAYMEAV